MEFVVTNEGDYLVINQTTDPLNNMRMLLSG